MARLHAHDNVWIVTREGKAFPGEFLRYMPNHCVKTCSGKFGIQTWPRIMVKRRKVHGSSEVAA